MALAGYSLAGLFALYAAHKAKAFSRFVAASPSAWFPRFVDFAKTTPFATKPQHIYLSLGDAEAKTKIPCFPPFRKMRKLSLNFIRHRESKLFLS